MLVKILLILAILAGIAAVILGFTQIKPKIEDIQSKLVDETKERLRQTKLKDDALKDLAKTKDQLKDEIGRHEATKSALAGAREENQTLKREKQGLENALAKETAEKTAAQQELSAWTALGIPVNKIKETIENLKLEKAKNDVLQDENKMLAKKIVSLEAYIEIIMGKRTVDDEDGVPMSAGLRAKVVAVDPKWDCVILDVGKNQEARVGGNMLVYRDGKLISKVKIRSLTDNTSVATVMLGWKLVDIQEGDLALHREVPKR
jgi:uncharacterized protein YdcH (DUF465 family)